MSSLLRLLIILAVLGAVAFAGMWALVHYVEPTPREMTDRVPLDRVLDN